MNVNPPLGTARCPGRGWDEYIREDSRPLPPHLASEHYEYLGSDPIPASRYTSPEYFQREVNELWPRVWQYAAREEDIPKPGDFIIYENVGRSFLLTRQADGSIKALYNACLHRGRKLATTDGSSTQFRCRYHGFSWKTNGELKEIPCRWDFGHLKDEQMALPEAQVGTWGGYIFIREAAEGPSLDEYLSPIQEHFAEYRHEDLVTVAWVGKVVAANWKVVAEAFMESWHAHTTHPSVINFIGDANARYHVYGDNINFTHQAQAVISPHLYHLNKDEQWIADKFTESGNRRTAGDIPRMIVPEGSTARRVAAEENRKFYSETTGRDLNNASDAEMLDSIFYTVFPNMSPWGGFRTGLVYRWRPWPDFGHTLMEARVLAHLPPGAERKRSIPMRLLRDDESWESAMGFFGSVLDQDYENLPHVQTGMNALKDGNLQLGNYQEVRIRHLHRTLQKYVPDNP